MFSSSTSSTFSSSKDDDPQQQQPLHLVIPQHSDCTVPMDNSSRRGGKRRPMSPPTDLYEGSMMEQLNDGIASSRSIFNTATSQKYHLQYPPPQQPQHPPNYSSIPTTTRTGEPSASSISSSSNSHLRSTFIPARNESLSFGDEEEDGDFPHDASKKYASTRTAHRDPLWVDSSPHDRSLTKHHHYQQSFVLAFSFLCIWTPNNIMAPNLTQMATDFSLSTQQRDLYLGSYCAIATAVCSLPIATGIGIATDVVQHRKVLWIVTVLFCAFFTWTTAYSTQFGWLLLSRLFTGGCMSGSVPIVFSFLGDLFEVHERNTASSGFTAMMGAGIILGQVYAGAFNQDWRHSFIVSATLIAVSAVLCFFFVHEPVRGGKERVLQEMIRAGTRYERTLTWEGFVHALRHNPSNRILLWQGFFSSLPWGILFVFLNDYLSQEKGFSVREATYLVLLFGIGCAMGGILGGYAGQWAIHRHSSYLPLFMALTTFLGIFPFLILLNASKMTIHITSLLSVLSGLIASLPSVNVRPCLINVNPPETRGASLTAANLFIQLGRGLGPSCVTLLGNVWKLDRTAAFNVTLTLFWTLSSIQLLWLVQTLPKDQARMEDELATYAQEQMSRHKTVMIRTASSSTEDANLSLTIEDRMTYFDSTAAVETLEYVRDGLEEWVAYQCGGGSERRNGAIIMSGDEDETSSIVEGKNDDDFFPSERTPLYKKAMS